MLAILTHYHPDLFFFKRAGFVFVEVSGQDFDMKQVQGQIYVE